MRALLPALMVIGLAAGYTPASGQQPAEFIVRGTILPEVREAAKEAVIYSLNSMAGLGAVLSTPPKIYFVNSTGACADLHVEIAGYSRASAELRCSRYTGMTWPGAYVVNMQNVLRRHPRDYVEFMWWLMPHELWHLYQHETGMYKIGMPWAFVEGTADLHKFKVLDERRIIRFASYVTQTVIPRAKQVRAVDPQFSIRSVGTEAVPATLTQDQIDGRYRMGWALGVYLHNELGGWPKIVTLHAPGATSFAARLDEVYGTSPFEFEAAFWAWLARQ